MPWRCAGEPEAIRELEVEHGLNAVLVDQRALALSEAFLTTGTPSAVLIAPDGAVASYVAAGSDEIEALVDRALPRRRVEEGLAGREPCPRHSSFKESRGTSEPLVDPLGKSTRSFCSGIPGCGYCQSLLPTLLAWEQEEHYSAPRLLVVSSG